MRGDTDDTAEWKSAAAKMTANMLSATLSHAALNASAYHLQR